MFNTIDCDNLTLSFPHKICFDAFTARIPFGTRLAIIGDNGQGKSLLLKFLAGVTSKVEGSVDLHGLTSGYIPQTILNHEQLSGGQKFDKQLTEVLSHYPGVLFLDEPTNHLDTDHRNKLFHQLKKFDGTLIFVSHDEALLSEFAHRFWHIHDATIDDFQGDYQSYCKKRALKRKLITEKIHYLNQEKRQQHHALMKEQERAKKSRLKGKKSIEQRKWSAITSQAKADRSAKTSGKKKVLIEKQKQAAIQALEGLTEEEMITPSFRLPTKKNHAKGIFIDNGSVAYDKNNPILNNIQIQCYPGERLRIIGKNGAGKSTLFKGILSDKTVYCEGNWVCPKPAEIGIIDQHYQHLSKSLSVYECIAKVNSTLTPKEIRCHLNDFLFKKNEEVNAQVETLSGGEKARLSLAIIAANPPRVLLLDEVTNNIDLSTKAHLINVFNHYKGTLVVISHDEGFARAIGCDKSVVLV